MEKVNKEYEEAITECIKTAVEAGSPEDQVRQFLSCGYVPLHWQWKFHALARECDKTGGPVKLGAGGARGPGKSHGVFAQVAIDDCQRVPNLKFLFLRQTGKAAQESFEDLIARVLMGKVGYDYKQSTLRFPNGSRIMLGGFYNEKDIDQYIGIEYDGIAIEELNQLTDKKIDKLLGSMRTSKDNWRPRLYASFNPGGIGHQFVKDTFVKPFRNREEFDTRYVPSTYKQNPYLNKEYIDYLQKLKGALGVAWREGDFDIFEGQYFAEYRYEIHVCEPFTLPREWPRYICGDYGYAKPSAVYWYAVNQDEQIFVYRELYQTNLTYGQLAKKIVEITGKDEKKLIRSCTFDPAIKIRSKHTGISGQEEMGNSLTVLAGDNDRIAGWNRFHEYLAPYTGPDGKRTAKLQIFRTCQHLIETIPLMIFDETIPEDLNTDLEDHAVDSIRYGLMSRPYPQKQPRPVDLSTLPPATLQEKVDRELANLHNRSKKTPSDDLLGNDY
jgi:phage terminase large subunit